MIQQKQTCSKEINRSYMLLTAYIDGYFKCCRGIITATSQAKLSTHPTALLCMRGG